jgi:hypothetical protein
MAHILKRITLAAALVAMAGPFGTAQAQTGYEYLFWPYFTAFPAPPQVHVQAAAPASAPAPTPAVAAPRHAPSELIRETVEVGYTRPAELGHPAYGSPHSVILGVGF